MTVEEEFPKRLVDQTPGGAGEPPWTDHLRRVVAHRPDVRKAVALVEPRVRARAHHIPRPPGAVPLIAITVATSALVTTTVTLALRRKTTPERPAAAVIAEDTRAPSFVTPVPTTGTSTGEVESPPLAPCTLAGGRDLAVCTATYMGGPGDDGPTAIELLPSGAIAYAGTLEGTDLGVVPRRLFAGGPAAIVRLGAEGRRVLSLTRLGQSLNDMKIDRAGRIYVLGQPFGLAVLDTQAETVQWNRLVGGSRLAVGSDGTVAVLDPLEGRVHLFAADGSSTGGFALDAGRASFLDIAVQGGTRTVVLTGALPGQPQQPFVRAHGYDGQLKWQNWGWSDGEAAREGLTAMARGLRVIASGEKTLYLLGESNGATSAFFRDARDPRRLPEAIVRLDRYTDTSNVGNQFLTVVARIAADTGAVEALQFHLTRNDADHGRGRTMRGQSLAADEHGNVFISGYQACCMDDKLPRTVRGRVVKPGGRDAFVLALSPDFRQRLLWQTFGTGGSSLGVGVAAGKGLVATIAVQDRTARARGPLVTFDALQPQAVGGATDGYLAVWPTGL